MRDATTDAMGDQLQRAFERSRLSVAQFMHHLHLTRGVCHVTEQEIDQPEFMVRHNNRVLHFYFSDNRWWCKA